MNNVEIFEMMKTHPYTRLVFAGVFARDTLPIEPRSRRPAAYIVNTADSYSLGEHWVCIYIPSVGPKEYFDSFGQILSIDPIFEQFMNYDYIKNCVVLQNMLTTVCGQYCLYYISMRFMFRERMNDVILNLLDCKRANVNIDAMINQFCREMFARNLTVVDVGFIHERLLL